MSDDLDSPLDNDENNFEVKGGEKYGGPKGVSGNNSCHPKRINMFGPDPRPNARITRTLL
jgi:hypothetical protein